MVVAVTVVGVVQSPTDEEVDVIAVGHLLVAAAGAVSVLSGVPICGLGVPFGILGADRDHVLVNVVPVGVVQMTVVQEVHVIIVPDGGVAAVGAVDVLV